METLGERLAEFVRYKNLSISAFEIKAGVSNGTVQKIIKNKTDTSTDNIRKIFREFPDLNLEWLISGEGEMIKQSDKEATNSKLALGQMATNLFTATEEIKILRDDNKKLKAEIENIKNKKGAI